MTAPVRNNKLIVLINLMYFQAGMLVSIISALIPNIIESYHISYTIAATLPFAFFFSFTFFCIPAGIANERFSPKKVLLFSLWLALFGVFLFVIFSNYYASVISLFIIGSAIAINQVSTVPLLRRICGPENLAFHSALNQLVYGFGAFLSPMVFSFLTTGLLNKNHDQYFIFHYLSLVTPVGYEWVSSYWFFALIIAITLIFTIWLKFPTVNNEHKIAKENKNAFANLIKNKYVIFYFIALAAYASCEQGNAVWMSKFFQDYHALNPLTGGASILSWYWILLSSGCLAGMLLLKIFDSRKVLGVFATLALVSFTLGIYAHVEIARIAYPLVGLFESVMWPIIISLALNSVSTNHEALTGLLYTASFGGAIGPFVIGSLGDHFGLRLSLQYIYLPLIIVLGVAFWAKPLISNRRAKTKILMDK